MKTFLSFASSLALTASLLVVTSGCNRFENQIQPESTPSGEARVGGFDLSNGGFDPALFASKIEAQLTGKVTGYGYRIMINGQPYTKAAGGKGYARHLIDAPARVYTPVVRQDIGGCTKFMTAVVVLKMLKRYDVPLEETVWTYLPTYFKPSTDFKKVTFRDLLAHTSGVVDRPKSAEYTIEDVQDSVEDGIFDQGEGSGGIGNGQKPYGQYYYQHMNYMLLRHALVYLVAKKDPNYIRMDFLLLKESRTDKSGLYDLIRHQFSFLLQQEVLKPAGWNQNQYESVGDHPSDNGPNVLYYPVVNPTQPGSTGNGWSQVGTNFMNISADELAGLMTAVRYSKVANPWVLTKMKTGDGKGNQIGFDDVITGQHGKYYHKKGAASGGNAILMDFDGPQANIQVAITTNNANGLVTNAKTWADAFDASWK